MAITDAYASAAEYRAGINRDDTSEDADVLLDLTAVSRFMERKWDHFWTKDASAVTRVYNPKYGGRSLDVDNLVSVTSLTVDSDRDGSFADETALTTAQYELWPLNAADGPEPNPYTQLYIPEWSTASLWTPGCRVQVVGVFGWPAVPEAIKRVCIHLTAFLRQETPSASRSVLDTGEILEASPHIRGVVNDMMRQYAGVPAL